MTDQNNGVDSEPWRALGMDAEDYARVERDASFSAIAGMISGIAAVMVCCFVFIGVPGIAMGFVAILLGKRVIDTGVGGAPRAYAYSGIALGILGVLWSGFVTFCICAYLGVAVVLPVMVASSSNF